MTSKLTGEGDEEEVKKSIAIFGYKQRLLSLDMKTIVVQHVPRINLTLERPGGAETAPLIQNFIFYRENGLQRY